MSEFAKCHSFIKSECESHQNDNIDVRLCIIVCNIECDSGERYSSLKLVQSSENIPLLSQFIRFIPLLIVHLFSTEKESYIRYK